MMAGSPVQWPTLLQYAVTQGPHILVQGIALDIRIFLTMFKGAGIVFLTLTGTCHIR